jgi:hypothetical protein
VKRVVHACVTTAALSEHASDESSSGGGAEECLAASLPLGVDADVPQPVVAAVLLAQR